MVERELSENVLIGVKVETTSFTTFKLHAPALS